MWEEQRNMCKLEPKNSAFLFLIAQNCFHDPLPGSS